MRKLLLLQNSHLKRGGLFSLHFCISKDVVSDTADAKLGDSSKESNSFKDKTASRSLPKRKSALHPAIF